VNAGLFLADLHRKPELLRALASEIRTTDPWAAALEPRPERVVLIGMGSSAYAAGVAAARLRRRGVVAVAELASSDLMPQWGAGTLVVATSASGTSRETLDALDRLSDDVTVVAPTNQPDSPLAKRCEHTIPMHAEGESGGVACRSYQHTLALLLSLESSLTGAPRAAVADAVEQAAEASAHLLSRTESWLPDVTSLLAGPDGTHLAAPARRLSSAHQGALMLREGPRRFAVGCEAGDWAHVDVYLTKNTDYRLLVFAGSSWDDGITEWTVPRRTTVVAVGGDFPGAALVLRYPHDDVDDVRLLAEVLVPELVAARLWTADSAADPDTEYPETKP
jgi:glucosamine 6-phosphate synthetase-like amidotransferase/phosphosugar isomerase protein